MQVRPERCVAEDVRTPTRTRIVETPHQANHVQQQDITAANNSCVSDAKRKEVLIQIYRKGKITEAFRAFKTVYFEVVGQLIDYLNLQETGCEADGIFFGAPLVYGMHLNFAHSAQNIFL